MGIAEADQRMDIEGYDAAAKLLIAANAIMNTDAEISDAKVSGLNGIVPQMVQESRRKGCALRLVGQARRLGDGVQMKVGLEEVPPWHPFHSVDGMSKAVMFDTDLLGKSVLVGGELNPELAAETCCVTL